MANAVVRCEFACYIAGGNSTCSTHTVHNTTGTQSTLLHGDIPVLNHDVQRWIPSGLERSLFSTDSRPGLRHEWLTHQRELCDVALRKNTQARRFKSAYRRQIFRTDYA